MGKLSFLAGLSAGYVLGARAGEERYEQIKLAAGQVWSNPAVQEQVSKATETAKERGPQIAAAAGQAAVKGLGSAAKNAATAGVQAATGKGDGKGPVVRSRVAEIDDENNPTSVGFVTPRHGGQDAAAGTQTTSDDAAAQVTDR